MLLPRRTARPKPCTVTPVPAGWPATRLSPSFRTPVPDTSTPLWRFFAISARSTSTPPLSTRTPTPACSTTTSSSAEVCPVFADHDGRAEVAGPRPLARRREGDALRGRPARDERAVLDDDPLGARREADHDPWQDRE